VDVPGQNGFVELRKRGIGGVELTEESHVQGRMGREVEVIGEDEEVIDVVVVINGGGGAGDDSGEGREKKEDVKELHFGVVRGDAAL
jgi:hypothetical protein